MYPLEVSNWKCRLITITSLTPLLISRLGYEYSWRYECQALSFGTTWPSFFMYNLITCRKEIMEYMENMTKVRKILSELLSEALRLSSDYLAQMDCLKSAYLACLYYPPCPEPKLALGTINHSDSTFLTMVIQDSSGGLQVLHQNHWVDVPPIPGAIVVNIGDHMQVK